MHRSHPAAWSSSVSTSSTRLLAAATQRLATLRTEPALFETLTQAVLDVMPAATRASVALLDDQGENYRVVAARGPGLAHQGSELSPVEGSIVGRAIRAGQGVLVQGLTAGRFREHRELLSAGVSAKASVPIRAEGITFGTLNCGARGSEPFEPEDVDCLALLARFVGERLHSIRRAVAVRDSIERARARADSLEQVAEAAERLGRALSEEEVYASLLAGAIPPSDAASASLALIRPDGASVEVVAVDGASPPLPLRTSILLPETSCARALELTRPHVVDDLANVTTTDGARVRSSGARTSVFVPLGCDRGQLGVLIIARRDDADFSRIDLERLDRLASIAGPQIDKLAILAEACTERRRAEAAARENAASIDDVYHTVRDHLDRTLTAAEDLAVPAADASDLDKLQALRDELHATQQELDSVARPPRAGALGSDSVGIAQLTQQVVDAFVTMADVKSVTLLTSLAVDLPTAISSAGDHLEQALRSLVGHAVTACTAGDVLIALTVLERHRDEYTLRLSVTHHEASPADKLADTWEADIAALGGAPADSKFQMERAPGGRVTASVELLCRAATLQ